MGHLCRRRFGEPFGCDRADHLSDVHSLINNSGIICVFGASLGKSDSDYWEQIAKWLKGAENRRLIIFKYDSKVKKTNVSYYQQYVKQQEVRDKFLDFTNYDAATRTKLCERIHVVINAPKTFVIPDTLKVKSPEEKNREAIDKAIQETIRELASTVKPNSNEKEDKQETDAIDQYNASLPPITVV